MSEKKLRPCPFCGETPHVYEIPAHKHGIVNMPDFPGQWYVECSCDDNFFFAGATREEAGATREEAGAKWNRRALMRSWRNDTPGRRGGRRMKIEKKWITESGLIAICGAQDMGHRCGYVGVEADHPLYGKNYDAFMPGVSWADMKDKEIRDREIVPLFCANKEEGVRLDCYFDVHGGLTYSRDGVRGYPIDGEFWWFGFDCAHCDDGKDFSIMSKKYKEFALKYPSEGTVRDLDYVVNQCEKLAKQLVGVAAS